MKERFTENARMAINLAAEAAKQLAHGYIGTEHLLLGLLHTNGAAASVLKENNVQEERILELVSQLISTNTVAEYEGEGKF